MTPKLATFLALCMVVLLASVVHPESADQGQDYRLLVAAHHGNAAELQRLLDAGVSPDFACHGLTPLIACSLAGHQEVAQLLVARGADVNFRSETGPTALMAAAANDHADLVQFLLDHDAEPNVKASFIWTQLTLTGDACRDLDQLGIVDELCVKERLLHDCALRRVRPENTGHSHSTWGNGIGGAHSDGKKSVWYELRILERRCTVRQQGCPGTNTPLVHGWRRALGDWPRPCSDGCISSPVRFDRQKGLWVGKTVSAQGMRRRS